MIHNVSMAISMKVKTMTQLTRIFQPFSNVNKRIVLNNNMLAPRISNEAYSFCFFIFST